MRATVFTDPALAKQAGRFVWLSIDTEDEKNAGYLAEHPWKAVPTFQVLDPKTGQEAYGWVGAVDVAELNRRLDEAHRAVLAGSPAAPRRPDVELTDLAMDGKSEECAARAQSLLPRLPPGPVRASVAATGLDCALRAAEDAPWRAAALATLEPAVKDALDDPGLLDDDRSALRGVLVDARQRGGDERGAKEAALAWCDYLDRQAREAANPEARAALDGHRVSAALAAGTPERALEPLRQSERQLPRDYNPPARLAVVLGQLGRYDEALAASDRALQRAYGPRKLTLYDARATILENRGDREAMRRVLDEALAYAANLPEPQRPTRMVERLERRRGGV